MLKFVNYSKEIFGYLIFVLIFTLITSFIIDKIISKEGETKSKILLFGTLEQLTSINIISYCLLYINFTFFIWSILFSNSYKMITLDYHFYMLLFSMLVFDIINGKVFKIIFDIVNNIILFFILYMKVGFYEYTTSVNMSFYAIILYIIIIIFGILYQTYFTVRNIDYLLKSDKYLKREDKPWLKKLIKRRSKSS